MTQLSIGVAARRAEGRRNAHVQRTTASPRTPSKELCHTAHVRLDG